MPCAVRRACRRISSASSSAWAITSSVRCAASLSTAWRWRSSACFGLADPVHGAPGHLVDRRGGGAGLVQLLQLLVVLDEWQPVLRKRSLRSDLHGIDQHLAVPPSSGVALSAARSRPESRDRIGGRTTTGAHCWPTVDGLLPDRGSAPALRGSPVGRARRPCKGGQVSRPREGRDERDRVHLRRPGAEVRRRARPARSATTCCRPAPGGCCWSPTRASPPPGTRRGSPSRWPTAASTSRRTTRCTSSRPTSSMADAIEFAREHGPVRRGRGGRRRLGDRHRPRRSTCS